MKSSLLLLVAACGLAFGQTAGYWKLVDTRTHDVPNDGTHNVQETFVRAPDGISFHQTTMIFGPLQGADVSFKFAMPPSVLIPNTPFPVSFTGATGWYAYDKGAYGYGVNFEAFFDTIAGQEDVWNHPASYLTIASVDVGVNYTGAHLSVNVDNTTAAKPVLVPASNWAPGPKARASLRYATTGSFSNHSWGWVYEWTAGTPGGCGGTCKIGAAGQPFAAGGGTGSIVVTATSSWSAVPMDTWIQVSAGGSGSGNGNVSFTVAQNTGPPRTGTISVAGSTYTIYQNGTATGTTAGCSYLIQSSTTQTAPIAGTTSGFIQVVTAQTCSWTSSVAVGQNWITIVSGQSLKGNGAVAYTVPANTTGSTRSGAIVIAGQMVVINQDSGPPLGTPVLAAGGVVNTASYAPGGPPSGSLAPGSYFSIYGSTLGPDPGVKADTYPLPKTLGGVGVRVTQGSNNFDCYLVYAGAGQINAILPSTVALGAAQASVTYNGKVSTPADIVVAATSVGLFFQTVSGVDMAIAQNVASATDYPLNLPSVPAKPGQIVILWGTGMGAIAAPDNVAPPGGDMTQVPVQIRVGGVLAPRLYAGRQPQTAAVDNIYFTVPEGTPFGCQVPVTITAGGKAANTIAIAITVDGKPCQ